MSEQHPQAAPDGQHTGGDGWYLYMIETEQGRLYTGITTDVIRRFAQHKSGRGGAKFFRTDPPLQVVLTQYFADQSSALKAEFKVKQLKRKEKLAFIDRFLVGAEIES